jgi:hypothetical protein
VLLGAERHLGFRKIPSSSIRGYLPRMELPRGS